MKLTTKYLISVCVAALAVTGCNRNFSAESDSNFISFGVRMADASGWDMTKAASVTGQFTDNKLTGIDQFQVTGYDGDGTEPFIDDQTAFKSGSLWQFEENPQVWVDGHSMTFWASANIPSWASATVNDRSSSALEIGAIPTEANEQCDPLIGYYSGTGDKGRAVITFYHPLAAIMFKTGDLGDPKYNIAGISRVKMKGVYASGSASISAGTPPVISWTPSGFTDVTGSFTGTGTGGRSAQPFLLIPQSPESDNVILEVTVSRSGGLEDKTMYALMNTGEWQAGRTYTYTLDYVNGGINEEIVVTLLEWGIVTTSSGDAYFEANYN